MYQSIPKPPIPPGQSPGILLTLSSVEWGIWPKTRPAWWGFRLSWQNVCQWLETKGFRNSLISIWAAFMGHCSCRFHMGFSVVIFYSYTVEYAFVYSVEWREVEKEIRTGWKFRLYKRVSFIDVLKCLRYGEIWELINCHIFRYIEFILFTVLLEHLGAF